MSRDVVLQQLDERSAAYRAEAERLRAEAERITGLLAVCEAELERLVTARQGVGELPAVHVAAAVADRPALFVPRTGSAEVREVGQDAAAPFAEEVNRPSSRGTPFCPPARQTNRTHRRERSVPGPGNGRSTPLHAVPRSGSGDRRGRPPPPFGTRLGDDGGFFVLHRQ